MVLKNLNLFQKFFRKKNIFPETCFQKKFSKKKFKNIFENFFWKQVSGKRKIGSHQDNVKINLLYVFDYEQIL